MKEFKKLSYCRMRPREGCKVQTYAKDAVCSSCRRELQELADKMALITELKIVADPNAFIDDTDL